MFTRDTVRFGIIAGLLPLLSMMAGNLFGWYGPFPERVFAIFFASSSFGLLLCILAAVTRRRKSLGPGEVLSFKGGVRLGAAVSIIAAALVAISMPLYFDILDPAWRDDMAASALARMTKEGVKASQIEAQVKTLREMSTSSMMLRNSFTTLLTGLLEAGVAAFLVRTMPPAHPAE